MKMVDGLTSGEVRSYMDIRSFFCHVTTLLPLRALMVGTRGLLRAERTALLAVDIRRGQRQPVISHREVPEKQGGNGEKEREPCRFDCTFVDYVMKPE